MPNEKVDLAQFLNQQYLCESLTIREVQTLIDYTELVVYSRQAVIEDIGDVGDALYFVIQGESALFTAGQTDRPLVRIQAGELMGEMSFFDREPRSVQARAMADNTRLLRLSRIMYNRLRVEHPYIAVNLLEHAIISLDHLFRQVSSVITARPVEAVDAGV